MVGTAFVPISYHVLNLPKFRLLPKYCPRELRVGWRFMCAYAGLLVNATMIAVLACQRLQHKGNEEEMLTARDHGRRDLLSLTTVGSTITCWIIHTSAYRNWAHFSYQRDLQRPSYHVGKPVLELTHRANLDHRTPPYLSLSATANFLLGRKNMMRPWLKHLM